MQHHPQLPRRRFFRQSGVALAASLLMGSAVLWPEKSSRAGELLVLSNEQAATLLAVSRTLFPHDGLDDGYYMNVVNAIDMRCGRDEKTRATVVQGLARLNRAAGKPFVQASGRARENLLRAMEKSEFFQIVYGETLNGLYNNPDVWKKFGYEGSSVEYGGYLHRGFDDIDWLPSS